MDQSALQVLLPLILILFMPICNCQQHTFFFIKSANSSYCPEQADASQCYDLNTFISGKYWLTSSNTTLLFFPGEHFLELDLVVRNTEVFLMIPYIQSNDSPARISITCTNHGQTIQFTNVAVVKVDSISFHSCGVDDYNYEALQLKSVDSSEITSSKWYESRSSAILIWDSNTVISDCQFMRGNCSSCSGGGIHAEKSNVTLVGNNTFAENKVWFQHGGGLSLVASDVTLDGKLVVVDNFAGVSGGGMYLFYSEFSATNASFLFVGNNIADGGGGLYFMQVNASIAGHTVIASNSAKQFGGGGSWFEDCQCYFAGYTMYYNNSCLSDFGHGFNGGGGGLVILGGNLVLKNANFTQNLASFGGAVFSRFNTGTFGEATFAYNNAGDSGGGIALSNTNFVFTGHVSFYANTAADGGGIAFEFSECTFESTAIFSGNKANDSGGSLRAVEKSNVTFLSVVYISASTADWGGGGITIVDDSALVMSGEVYIEDSHAYSYGGAIVLDHSVLRMEESSEITSNSAQYGGAIHAIASKLYFIGNHLFKNNYAQLGGGLSLSDGSLIYFYNTKTHLSMISNHVDKYGGALWIEDASFYTCNNEKHAVRRCFYQLQEHHYSSNLCIFKNNTAKLAGSNIYGGNVLKCLYVKITKVRSEEEFYSIFSSVNESTISSPISSDPIRVCLCTQYYEPDCSISNYTIEAFSGQQFPLTLVGVGQMNGTVPAVILSHTDPPSSNNTVKTTGSECSTMFYTINSISHFEKLILYPDSPCNNISTYMLTVLVNILPCPPGFMFQNNTKSCSCDDTVERLDIQCDINSQSFGHKHRVWIDYNQLDDNNKMVIYHPHCPFDYCIDEWTNFTFNSTDNQCRYNRSGLICGACKEGYSLTLGGSQCAQCSHIYLFLFLPLAVAGVVLVFFLLTFRLTVSMGTINGLIFFGNIVGTNSSIFLPSESTAVLRVFIAWLNLDLGINTCLFDGLDMYVKVWLQFIFPFYVFLLIGIIIVISHHSTTFTKYLGNDPVAVLATLILLAYTKLFHVVLTVMSFTYIQALDGSSITVWLYDGNVRYLNGKHIPLFMFALLIFFFLIVPYTMILLFAPYLQPYTKIRVLFWIDDYRLKSFLHCYYAVIKDKYRSWIGILLVLRLCLLLVFVLNSLGDPSVNIFAIATVVVLLLCWRVNFGTFYTKWYLDTLELFFIMKLGLFSIAILYVLNSNGNQTALTDTIIGVSFTAFMAIIIYHGWRQLTDSRWYRNTLKPKWQKYFNSSRNNSHIQQEEDEHCEPQPQAPPQVSTTFIELREPLLDS